MIIYPFLGFVWWSCRFWATFKRVWANIQSTWTNRGAFEIWSRQATSTSQLELSICAILTSLTSSHSPVTRIGRSLKTFKDYFLVMRWDITFCHWCWLSNWLVPAGFNNSDHFRFCFITADIDALPFNNNPQLRLITLYTQIVKVAEYNVGNPKP